MLVGYYPDCVIFDIETTGLSPETDAIVELSAVKVKGGEVTAEFSTLVDPGIHIPYEASAINGITDDMVCGAPPISQVMKDFMRFAEGEVLVGHNIRNFDLRFMNRDAEVCLGCCIPNEYVDTLVMARRYLPELQSRSLQNLAYHYGISYAGAHRALADCYITLEVYRRLKEEADAPSEAAKSVPTCPLCGNVLSRRKGKFGEFWGCRSYPDCRYTKDV